MKKIIAKEARKQIMYAVDFRDMHTGIHGLYYGKDKKRVEEFAKEIEYIHTATDMTDDDIYFAWESLFQDYPDIKTIEEVNYRDFEDLPGGYKGLEDDDTIYRFVNNVALDLYMESSKKVVKESYDDGWRSVGAAFDEWVQRLWKYTRQDRDNRMEAFQDCTKACEKAMKDYYDTIVATDESTEKPVEESTADNDGEPRIYVGTYAKYNNGSLDGKWVDLMQFDTYEEFVDYCRELHKDEKDPEFMVQDFENYPEKWYHEGGLPTEEEFDKITDFYMLSGDRKAAYEAYVNHTGDDDFEHFEEAYQGKFNSAEDFAYDLVDGIGWDGVGENNLEMYFDYDSFGRDLMYDFHRGDEDETDAEGNPEDPDKYYDQDGYEMGEYESDDQVARDYIDNLGGVAQLGTETAQRYFDYDSFGRDLLINDYFEEDGYVFLRM